MEEAHKGSACDILTGRTRDAVKVAAMPLQDIEEFSRRDARWGCKAREGRAADTEQV